MNCEINCYDVYQYPMPADEHSEKKTQPKTTEMKIKIYQDDDIISSIRSEFEQLYTNGYTHVVNMPGKLDYIIPLARYFKFVYLDHRLIRYISDRSNADIIEKNTQE